MYVCCPTVVKLAATQSTVKDEGGRVKSASILPARLSRHTAGRVSWAGLCEGRIYYRTRLDCPVPYSTDLIMQSASSNASGTTTSHLFAEAPRSYSAHPC